MFAWVPHNTVLALVFSLSTMRPKQNGQLFDTTFGNVFYWIIEWKLLHFTSNFPYIRPLGSNRNQQEKVIWINNDYIVYIYIYIYALGLKTKRVIVKFREISVSPQKAMYKHWVIIIKNLFSRIRIIIRIMIKQGLSKKQVKQKLLIDWLNSFIMSLSDTVR